MFVLISPVQSYKWEDTGRIAPGPGPQRPTLTSSAVCAPSRSSVLSNLSSITPAQRIAVRRDERRAQREEYATFEQAQKAERAALKLADSEQISDYGQTLEGRRIVRYSPDGPPKGVHIASIHVDRKCITKASAGSVILEISPEDLDSPFYRMLPCCKRCGERIGKQDAPVECEPELVSSVAK